MAEQKITEAWLNQLQDMNSYHDGLLATNTDHLIAAYRAQQQEIRLLKQCNATDRELEIIKLKEEIALLKRQLHGTSQDADHYKEECGR